MASTLRGAWGPAPKATLPQDGFLPSIFRPLFPHPHTWSNGSQATPHRPLVWLHPASAPCSVLRATGLARAPCGPKCLTHPLLQGPSLGWRVWSWAGGGLPGRARPQLQEGQGPLPPSHLGAASLSAGDTWGPAPRPQHQGLLQMLPWRWACQEEVGGALHLRVARRWAGQACAPT